MAETAFFIIIFVLSIVGVLVVPRWLTLRAIPAVISMFRQAGAVGKENARPAKEIGLGDQGFIAKGLSNRNYKPRALTVLLGGEIIQFDDEGKLYLVEEKLALSKWSYL